MTDALAAIDPPEPEAEEEEAPRGPERDRDLLGRRDSKLRRRLTKFWSDHLLRGFQDQADRSDDLERLWRLWNCELDDNQFYNGNSDVYIPIIHDALVARVTRFANQLFPASGRYIDCTSSDGGQPYEVMALATHRIDQAKLKTQIVRPLLLHGDIEGQYNLYVGVTEVRRQIVSRETAPDEFGEDVEDVVEEEVVEQRPTFEVLHDSDVLILPANADSVDDALQRGGSVTIVRRWSKPMFEQMVDDGELNDEFSEKDFDDLIVTEPGVPGLSDISKEMCKAVGVRGRGKHILAFETWMMLPLDDEGKYSESSGTDRLCRVWFGLNRRIFGAKRNPYWNDLCPLLSAPVEKIAGSVKGKSQVEHVAQVQYEANDAANERADVDHMGAMPIIRRSPNQGNSPLIIAPAAVWDGNAGEIEFMEFPNLSERAKARILDAYSVIFQSLSVNPSMLPQQTSVSRRNQAQVAQEQQVDMLTTAEAVSVLAEGILTPLAGWIVDLDHQFRDTPLTIRQFGELGIRAEMIDVPVLQNRTRYYFTWCGAEQAKMNVAMMQQGTAFINVLRGMRQDLQAEGYELKLGPMLERAAINIFGPMVGGEILVDQRRKMTVPADMENEMMAEGQEAPVHPLDNDAEHIQSHMPAMQQTGDPHGLFQIHIQRHAMQAEAKAAAMRKQMLGGALGMGPGSGAPGVPGGAGPGVAGTPRQGAVPTAPRQIKQQAGAMHPDTMPRGGVVTMPRKM